MVCDSQDSASGYASSAQPDILVELQSGKVVGKPIGACVWSEVRRTHAFLESIGVEGALAKQVVATYGSAAEARLRADPHAALRPLPAASFMYAHSSHYLKLLTCIIVLHGKSHGFASVVHQRRQQTARWK